MPKFFERLYKPLQYAFFGTLILVVVGVIAAFLFFGNGENDAGEGSGTGPLGLFGFGSELSGEPSGGFATSTPTNEEVPRLRQITAAPTSGMQLVETGDDGLEIRYVERASGHVYRTFADRFDTERLSNSTIPGISAAVFDDSGEAVWLRSFNNRAIETIYAEIASTTNQSFETTVFLDRNIAELAISPDGESIFFMLADTSGSRWFRAEANGDRTEQVFSSPIREWRAQWYSPRELLVFTKPANGENGLAYIFDTQTNTLREYISDVPGFVGLMSQSGRYLLYSSSSGAETFLTLLDNETGERRNLPFSTLPDKCAWDANDIAYCAVPHAATSGVYPDDWYKGIARSNDDIWIYNPAADRASLAYNGLAEGRAFDVARIEVDPKGTNLSFVERGGLTLWNLQIFK